MKPRFLVILVLLFWGYTLFAQNETYKNEAGFKTDNDGFLARGSDKYYTAGNFFYFRHALKIDNTNTSFLQNKVLSFELGQKIYTPQSGFIPSSIYVDRPFAGYLYVGSSLNLLYKNESNLKLEIQTGFVGRYSYGKEIQDLIHKTFGFYTPGGWQYQIQNNYEVNLSAEYNRLLLRGSAFDISLNTHADVGNGLTGASAGVLFRAGKFNQLFNSSSTTSSIWQNRNIKPLHDAEFFFYNKPLINYVAYNATVAGSLFNHKPRHLEITATQKPIIFTDQIGGSFVNGHWVLDLSVIFQSRETQEMVHPHQWGSVSVLYRFN